MNRKKETQVNKGVRYIQYCHFDWPDLLTTECQGHFRTNDCMVYCATRIVSSGNIEATGGHIVIPSLMYFALASNAFQKQSWSHTVKRT